MINGTGENKRIVAAAIQLVQNLNVPWLHLLYCTSYLTGVPSIFLEERLPWVLGPAIFDCSKHYMDVVILPQLPFSFSFQWVHWGLIKQIKIKKKKKEWREGEEQGTNQMKLSGLRVQAVALLPLGPRSTRLFISVPLSYGGLFSLLGLHMSLHQDNCSQQHELNSVIPPASWLTVN